MLEPLKYRGGKAPGCAAWSRVAACTLAWTRLADLSVIGAVMVITLCFLPASPWRSSGRSPRAEFAIQKELILGLRAETWGSVILNIENISTYPTRQHGAPRWRLPSPVLRLPVHFPHFTRAWCTWGHVLRAVGQQNKAVFKGNRRFIAGFHSYFLLFGKLYNTY